ncbi:MAG: adenosine kinase [Bacteroidales bacterium]|nr:adenosine kinase [Bacteroidales bacterium]MBN2763050.1 adenosine kinase [Bacteroidales bacterium]
MSEVLGIGNALVDVIIKLDSDRFLDDFNLPKGSMQLTDVDTAITIENACSGLSRSKASGGSAANTIHGLARLGISTGFIGTVGHDDVGRFFHDDMVKAGIKPVLSISKTETGRAISLVSQDSERTFATYLGAAVEISEKSISENIFKDYRILHIEGYLAPSHQFMEKALKMAKKMHMQASLDLASYNVVESNRNFLQMIINRYVDIVFANEEEAKAYTGLANPEDALRKMATPGKIVVVKTGKKGSLVNHNNKVCVIGITPAKAIDTTGAGDLYASGFLYGLIKGFPIEKCGQAGALLAANVIEEPGAKISEKRWEIIRRSL